MLRLNQISSSRAVQPPLRRHVPCSGISHFIKRFVYANETIHITYYEWKSIAHWQASRQRAAGTEIRITKGCVVRFLLSFTRADAFESRMTHIYLISGKRKLYLTPARKLKEKYVHLSRRHERHGVCGFE